MDGHSADEHAECQGCQGEQGREASLFVATSDLIEGSHPVEQSWRCGSFAVHGHWPEGYVSVKLKRKFVGVELKESIGGRRARTSPTSKRRLRACLILGMPRNEPSFAIMVDSGLVVDAIAPRVE